MPTEFRLNTTVGIGLIVGGLLNMGMTYQQFQQVKEDQKAIAVLVSTMRENQLTGLEKMVQIKNDQANFGVRLEGFDNRLNSIERALIIREKK